MRHPRVRALLLLVPLALAVAACGAEGSGSDAGPTTAADGPSTTAADDDGGGSTTVADDGGDETTTTEAGGGDDGGDDGADLPSTDELEALLPAADVLGSTWTIGEDDDGSGADPEADAQFAEQCPEVAALNEDDDDESLAARTYDGEDDAQARVKFESADDAPLADDLDAFVDALNACTDVTVSSADGSTITFSVQARTYEDYGDYGVQAQIDLTLENPQLPQAVALTSYALFFRRGPVSVSVTGTEGLDPATYEAVEFDTDVLLGLADAVDTGLADLVG